MFNQKEIGLLKEAKEQEQLCVDKYHEYSGKACDEELKNLFSGIEQTERQHLDTITGMLRGEMPSMSSTSGSQSMGSQSTGSQSAGSQGAGSQSAGSQGAGSQSMGSAAAMQDECWKKDKYLCSDSLSTEKHVSSIYNTSIFEFCQPQVRDALNHIQKEEQHHGEQIFNYMSAHGMYQVK